MIYISFKLSDGRLAEIEQITGAHMFGAMLVGGKVCIENPIIGSYYLLCECVILDGKRLSLDVLKEMIVPDINLLCEAVNSQNVKVQ